MRDALLIAVALALVGCGEERHTALALDGVRIARVEESLPAEMPGGVVAVPGDFVIEGEGLRVLVGGLRRAGEATGAILEATLDGAPADDSIVLVAPRLMVGASTHAVVAREMYVVERRGRPALRVEGEVRIGERMVNVHQELSVADAGSAISIVTRVAPEDHATLEQVRVVARIGWGGATPILPGVGAIDDEAWHDANWVARSGTEMATVFGYRTPPAHVRAILEQHGASRFLSYTNVASPRGDIGEDDAFVARSALVLGRPSIAEGLRRLGWIRGAPFPEVLFTLPYAPEGATIHVRTQDGEPLLDTVPDARGQALVPLTPVGVELRSRRWVAWATAYGHAASDEVTVAPDDRVTLVIPRGNRLRVRITDAATGRAVPGRIRIWGVGATPNPELGPEERADGALDTVIAAAGSAEVQLPPGIYRVTLTRGPEWTIVEEQVEVTRTFSPEVNGELSHVVDPGEWVSADFHLHASPSPDSQVTLEDRVASLVAEGVRFAVPTDHNHVTDYAPSAEALVVDDFGTIPGIEVTTWAPQYGHFNAYPWPLDPDAPAGGAPAHRGTTPGDLFRTLHEAGEDVIVQVNHPRLEHDIGYFEVMGLDPRTGSASDLFSEDFDVLEVWNGFDLARPEMFERVFQDWLFLLARGRRIVATGNSDSHKVHFQLAGYPRTYVRVPGGRVEEPLEVVRALRAGHAFVTSGPFLEVRIGDAGPGDTARYRGNEVDVHVTLRAPPWMDVTLIDFWVGPRIVRSVPVTPAPVDGVPPVVRFEGTVRVPVPAEAYLVAVARGERPMEQLFGRGGVPPVAFTNPIWLERDRPRSRRAERDGGPADAGAP